MQIATSMLTKGLETCVTSRRRKTSSPGHDRQSDLIGLFWKRLFALNNSDIGVRNVDVTRLDNLYFETTSQH